MKRKPKLGDILWIILLDHADKGEGCEYGPVVIETFGRLIAEMKTTYEVAYWGDPSGERDHNTDFTCVLKSAIVKLRVLK